MPNLRRRALLAATPALLLAPSLAQADAQAAPDQHLTDPRMADRAMGRPDAKIVVEEWFSLTCTHCAHFSQTVFPDVKAKLIDTGKIRYVFRDFPLDQLALAAAMVARALPPDQYLPFVETLFADQDAWAFKPDGSPLDALKHQAGLAGMPPSAFQATIEDRKFQQDVLAEEDEGNKRWNIQGTPTFIVAGRNVGGLASYDEFAAAVAKAA